jgi:tetratricopeptide (TPR) repeat protein
MARDDAKPEDLLHKAMSARTPVERARLARKGLATRSALDRTTHAMLLRQLYLSHYEARRFSKAFGVAQQALELDVLPDVLHQDAARAALADGDLDSALTHLRMAARRSPASRRAFHQWTLGSILFLAQRYNDAIAALERATRWGTNDKPLYRAHLALAKLAAGESAVDLQKTIDALAESPSGQGYGRFVLGHLAYAAGEHRIARRYLDAFVQRTEAGKTALGIALKGELEMSKATLAKMDSN